MKNLELNNIFIPSKTPSKKLMIILHGRGDSSKGFTFLPAFLNIDDLNYLLLDAPYEYFGGKSWYDLPPNQENGIINSTKILSNIFDDLFKSKFDIEQSILFGFSQGSLLTFEFGARYKNKLAGYIAISGYIFDEKKLLKTMNPNVKNAKWLCTHGTYDDILPYNVSKNQINYLQENNFDIEFKSYDKAHTIDNNELNMIKSWILETIKK